MTNSVLDKDDFYYNDKGLMVFTKKYHLKRGFCCKSGCQHCPFGFGLDADPDTPVELLCGNESSDQNELEKIEEILEKYQDEF